jgi:C-terminal processing protease CtpA/Prc
MKNKKLVSIGTIAALALGLVAVAAPAQDRDSDLSRATAEAVRQSVRQQTQLSALQAEVQIAQAITESISGLVANAVTSEVTARVNSKIRAVLAQQIAQSTPRVLIDGDGLTSLEETGWLGVTPEDVSADRAKELKLSSARGVYLSEVEKDSPAEKAGLKSGDVITEFNGEHVESVAQFRRLVRETPAGRTISITVWREGRSQTLSVTMGSAAGEFDLRMDREPAVTLRNFTLTPPDRELILPSAPRAYSFNMPDLQGWGMGEGQGNGNNYVFRTSPTPTLGISAESVSGQLGTYFGAPEGEGILVREVNSGSPAEKGGLKAGDVITKIDGDRVRTLNEMQSRLREKREAKTVQITVMRKGSETTITVEPAKPQTRPAAPRVTARPVSF